MNLAEYMRANHPPPKDYIEPLHKQIDITKHLHINIRKVDLDLARGFVLCSIVGAVCLPGKWGILSGVIGNAYWLYKIR